MKGIKLDNGVMFIYDGLNTVRVLQNGEIDYSPIDYNVLEWDLRTEPPDKWDYIFESDLIDFDDDLYKRIKAKFDEINLILYKEK